MKTQLLFAAACAMLALAAPARAATMSASYTAPVIDGADLANLGDVTGSEKWFLSGVTESPVRGQSFITGGAAVRLKSITYQVAEGAGAAPTKTYALRVGKVAGNNFTQIHNETATQSISWSSNQYMTWTFSAPVLLEPYTTYAIDIGMTGSTSEWQTGIPYLNMTADEYSGGTSYTSGGNGVGNSWLNIAISSDRIFHIDLENPTGPVFTLVAPSPADNATDAIATRKLVMTFSQTVTQGTGNLTIRNLTDNTDTLIPANDSRLIYDGNVVRVDPAGLITWSKDYAIRIDAGMFLGDSNAPIAPITDDTTWNFTTLANDPLLAAIAALKGHINNTAPLTLSQIAGHKYTIDNSRQRFPETAQIITAVFDLITTYETLKGPLFVSGSQVTEFSRSNTTLTSNSAVIAENYHWAIYSTMQHAMDWIYTAEVLAEHETLLTNYKFASHTAFPGPCSPPANPLNTHTVPINSGFPDTFGRDTLAWTKAARKPTGTYLAPGTIATVTVPPALVNAGYKIRVGAHSWDLAGRPPVKRLERATRLYDIDSATTKIASPYGGGIYIEVPHLTTGGVVNVTVTGGVRSPYFSAKSFHQTTPAEWDVERTHPAPWADFQSDKFMSQVPRKWIYNMTGAQATQLMVDWDKAMDAINDLMGFPHIRGKETMYIQTDVILPFSFHASGYPAVNTSSNPNSEVSPPGYAGSYRVRGPGADPLAAHIEFHEQGHAYFFPKFNGESESNVNFLHPALLNRAFGYSHDVAHAASVGNGSPHRTIDNTAVAWMTVFSFSRNRIEMQQAEKAYQHKGHAKFADIARIFGWAGLDNYWKSFMQDDANNVSYGNNTDDLLLRLSRHVGKDVRPLFHFWGIHPQNNTTLAAALAAENIPSSPEIKTQLLRYKSLVPANNATFRAYLLNWWGYKPQISGPWEETDHAMQWDELPDSDVPPSPHPNGDIYVESTALLITNRVQEIIDQYYPSTINPGAMSFAILPSSVDATTVGMTAVTATSGAGTIEYYFENTTNSTNSGWITTPAWTQTGLTTGLSYAYRVKARDGLTNETNWSPDASVTVNTDTTPPLPSTMHFSTKPYSLTSTSISMTAIAASDINGVEYYFDCTAGGGNDSGWQDSRTYIDTGLTTGVAYTYKVQARDKSSAQNAGPFSSTATATPIDVTGPTLASLVPAHLSTSLLNSDNLSITFNEPIAIGAGFITVKNLSDATQAQIAITDATQVSVSGSILTINPTANLLEGKTYAIRIDATAIDDIYANSYAGITNDTTWSFTVADPTPPAIVTLSPADSVTNAPANANLVVTFSENVTRGTGNITLKNLSDATQTAIAITDNTQVSLVGAVLTINPATDLLVGKNYAIQLASTAITDTATNPFPGISDDTTWNFTIVIPPNSAFWLGVTGNWSAPATWVDGVTTTGIDFNTYLAGIDITANQTVTLDSARTIGNITFTDTTPSNDATISGANTLTLDRSTGVPTIDVTQTGRALTISSVIAGSDGLQKNGLGTLTLTGNNTYTGSTTVSNGTLRLEGSGGGFFSSTSATRTYTISSGATLNLHAASVPVGTANLTGSGTLLLTGGGVSAGNSGRAVNMNLTAGAVIDIRSGSGLYNGGWQAFTWTNNKATLKIDGGLDIIDGKEVIGDALIGSGTVTSAGTTGSSAINFTLGVNNGSGTFSGNITAAGTRVVSLVKNGSGTQTFSGSTTFRGASTVAAGTLAITGTHSTTGVTVNNNATLGGNGNITGNVTIASGARHALAVAATPAAQVTRAITGTLTLTSGNILGLTAAVSPGPGTYVLATATTAITGTPTTINYNGILGTVTVDAASTPKRLLLTVTGSTYASWIAGFPAAAAMPGFEQDADGDGVKNGIENFFGTNPGTFSAGLIPGARSGNTFTFTHPQNATPATDITASYRWSKDLLTFHPSGFTDGANTTVTFTTQLNTPAPGITTVTATITGAPTARLLVDVRVSQN